jgi:hypothetical protein
MPAGSPLAPQTDDYQSGGKLGKRTKGLCKSSLVPAKRSSDPLRFPLLLFRNPSLPRAGVETLNCSKGQELRSSRGGSKVTDLGYRV